MKKYTLLQKVMALTLTLVMVIGLMPSFTLPTNAALADAAVVTDPGTADAWEDIMGTSADGARYAGRVWVDKSVYKDGDTVVLNQQGNQDSTFTADVDVENGEYFQVVFSALGSSISTNTTVTASRPLDVVIVLDTSTSMGFETDTKDPVDGHTWVRMEHMIPAANQLLEDLLALSDVRIAIVTYNANSETVIGLDKYENGIILSADSYLYNDDPGRGETNGGIITAKDNSGRTLGSDSGYESGTNLQSGIDRGMDILANAQNAEGRTPVAIVLTDGEANRAVTSNWYNIARGTVRNEFSMNEGITLSTLLNAAYGKTRVENNYNTEMTVYGIGVDLESGSEAHALMNPADSDVGFNSTNENEDVRQAYAAFEEWRTGETVTIATSNSWGWGSTTWTFDHNLPSNSGVTSADVAANINYVDNYQNVSSANLEGAFDKITEELSTGAFNPITDTSNGATGVEDTPLIYADNIGKYMEVKNVQAVQVFGTVYDVTKNADGTYSLAAGSGRNPTTKENWTTEDIQIHVIENADGTQQLRIYIEQEILPILLDTITVTTENGITTRTIDEAGYPPLRVYYTVGIDTDILLPNGQVNSTMIDPDYAYVDDATGMASFYCNAFNELNTTNADGDEFVDEGDAHVGFVPSHENRFYYHQAHQEIFISATNTDGSPIAWDDDMYGVRWEEGKYELEALTYADYGTISDSARVYTYVTFHRPTGSGNEAEEVTYLVYTTWGDLKTAATFYDKVNDAFLNGGSAIDADQVDAAVSAYKQGKNITNDDLIAVLGIQSRRVSRLHNMFEIKDQNTTGTAENSYAPEYNDGAHEEDDIHEHSEILVWLGNNGKVSLPVATGLKVTKDVTELADGASADEKFEIQVLLDWAYTTDNVAALLITDANGNALDSSVYAVSDSQGKILVTLGLADGESTVILGVPGDTTYTVTEAAHDKYSCTYTGATETVDGTIVEGVVTNQPIQPGTLFITKEVVHANGGEVFPTGYEFEFEVTFLDKDGNPIANTEFQLENNYDTDLTKLSTDANGVMRGKLCHGETVHIFGIPAGATVTVKEVNIPDNYTSTAYRSRNHSGAEADNDGVVTIESLQNATVVVTNTYTPKSTTVDLDIAGTKIFDAEGNENILPAGGFTFKVQKWNGQAWEDVDGKSARVEYAAKEDGTKTFTIDNVLQNITYTEAGTYTYQVLEVIGSVANVTYDRTLYTFTVTVTDNNGQLVATVTDLNNVEITDGSYEVTFENTFHTAPVSIDIAKEVENKSGSPEISKAGFKFVAKEAEVIEGVWSVKNGGKTLEVYSDGAGEARVTATYKEQGTHYYIVTEVGDGKNGWTYSDAEYHVTVEVTDDGTGDLSAALTIVAVDGTTAEGESAVANGNSGKIIFKNTYDPTDAELGLSTLVKKNLEGRDLVAGEFSFAIFENGEAQFNQDGNLTNIRDAVATGTNDASGNVTFTPEKLTFSEVGKYEYDIVEVKGNKGGVTYDPIIYDLVVEVADNGDGTLKATYYFEDSVSEQVTFENTYTVKGTEVVIDGIKTLQVLSGSKALHAGDYTFYLYNEDGNKIGETTNLANGTFKFDAIKYTGADIGKTYKYTVKEANAGTTVNGVTYSSQTFTVTVKVIDNGDGTLRTEVTGNGTANIKFVNEYTSELADVTLEGKKNLQNRDLTAGEFKFALYQADKNFENLVLVDDTITHDADGKFTVSINDLDAGYHFYVLKEVIPDTRAPGIHYYGGQYNITIHVTDSGNGQMTYTKTVVNPGVANPADTAIVFNNLYRPEPGELILSGSKTYLGGKTLEDDVFSVGLYEGTNLLQTADVKADKTFTFQALEYTADDVGKTYTYTVKEIIPNGAADNGNGTFTSGNDIYDGTIYTVVVTITDTDKDGALEITKTVNGTVDGPISFTNTFVPDPIQHSLQAKKTYEKGLKGGDFEFRLVSTDGKTNVDQTKENAANGDILFDPITFSAAGEYKFKLTEKKEGILSFIRPSEAEYEITVTVVNENGVLRVSNVAVVNIKNTGESNLEFINTYVMADEDEVILKGTKTLIGDRTTVNDKEFQFGLYDENGDLVETVWNDGNGDFQFSALKFTEKDVAVNGETVVTYTVKEIAGDNARYDYDDTIYTVVITIKDDDKGGIDVSYTVNNVANGAITFENTYTNPTPVTYTPVAKKNYNKPLTGGEFKFKLEGSIGNVTVSDEKTNAAGGIITFNTLSFPEVGTYTFKVTEIDKILGFIEYSAAEYEIVVKVIDTKGVLSIESVTINNDPNGTIEFTNTYKIDGEDEITLRGTKTLTGDRTTVKAGEFEFGLYDENGELVEKVSVKADGTFEFSTLKFDETDVPVGGSKQITYTVKEIAGSDPCMTYDETVYTVVVTVEDNGQGGVKVSYTVNGKADGKLAFTNTYTAPEDVVTNIYIQKKVNNKSEKGIGPDGFKFVLEFGDEELVDTSDKDGKAAFQITFGADDIGKTYEFKVYEKRGNTAGVTYDKTVYTVEVQVLQNPDGSIKTVINGKDTDAIALEFTNIYEKPVTPVTGDDFPIIALGSLLVISGAAMVVLMLTKKNKGGKYLA